MSAQEKEQYKVAIAIVFRDFLPRTIQCLASVAAFTGDFRLYLYDNGSSEETTRCVQRFLQTRAIPHVYMRSNADCGSIVPRNILFSLAVEPYFVCLHNDVVVGDGWCDNLLRRLEQDDDVWLVGAIPDGGLLDDREARDREAIEARKAVDYVETWCCAVGRQRIQKEFGCLFEAAHLDYALGEDSDLTFRIQERGGKVVAIDAPVAHLRQQQPFPPDSYALRSAGDFQERNFAYLVGRWVEGKPDPRGHVALEGRRFRRQDKSKRILVHGAETRYGRSFMLTALFRALRERHPDAEIDYFGRWEARAILRNNPHIDQLIRQSYTKRNFRALRRRYTRTYDLRQHDHPLNVFFGDVANGYELHCSFADETPSSYAPVFCPGFHDMSEAYHLLNDLDPDLIAEGFVLVHVETANLRRLPDETALAVANELARRGEKVLFVGKDAEFPRRIQALGGCSERVHFLQPVGDTYSIRTMLTLAMYAKLVVAVDSVLAHAAAAFDVPSVLVFGASDHRLRTTHFRQVRVLRHDVACGPCNQEGFECLARPGQVAPCMQEFSAEEIVEAACAMLGNGRFSGAADAGGGDDLVWVPEKSPACPSCSLECCEGVARIRHHAFYRCYDCDTIFSLRLEDTAGEGLVIIDNCLHEKDHESLVERAERFMADCLQTGRNGATFIGVFCEGGKPIWRDLGFEVQEIEIPISVWAGEDSLTSALQNALKCVGPQTAGVFLDDVLNRSETPSSLVANLRRCLGKCPVLGRLPISDYYDHDLFHRNCWQHFITPIAGQNRWIPSALAFFNTTEGCGYRCRLSGTVSAQEIVFHLASSAGSD